ncbi:MAG TPA: hypothetical protein DEA08_38815, partial [Planctomycetes bacterium]|nr:hypothetical protein [Planctomycetota bacterium]
ERRWRESGTDADQTAWLLERVRAGLASLLEGSSDMERAQAEVKATVARWALGGPAFPSASG